MPLCKRYNALGLENEVRKGQDAGKDSLATLIHQNACNAPVAQEKNVKSISNWRFLSERYQSTQLTSASFSSEVCCLPGAHICSITERPPRLAKPPDYHPLPLFHVGSHDTATGQLSTTRRDYMSLRAMLKESGAQEVFSSVLPVRGRGSGRRRGV